MGMKGERKRNEIYLKAECLPNDLSQYQHVSLYIYIYKVKIDLCLKKLTGFPKTMKHVGFEDKNFFSV